MTLAMHEQDGLLGATEDLHENPVFNDQKLKLAAGLAQATEDIGICSVVARKWLSCGGAPTPDTRHRPRGTR